MWNPESHSKPLECIPSFRAEPQLPLKHCLFCPAISSYLFSHILSEPKAWNALISQCTNVSIPFSNLASLPRTFSSSISFQDGRTASLHNSIPDVNGHCPILSGLFFMLTAACWAVCTRTLLSEMYCRETSGAALPACLEILLRKYYQSKQMQEVFQSSCNRHMIKSLGLH